jgi:hypothetical protein
MKGKKLLSDFFIDEKINDFDKKQIPLFDPDEINIHQVNSGVQSHSLVLSVLYLKNRSLA